jgi:PhnB protein
MEIQPYLFFEGRCDEALEFYRRELGAEVVMLMRYKEGPEGTCQPGLEEKVMHSAFRINGGTVLASDGMANGQPKFEGFSLALSARDEAEADRFFNALADGGKVQLPLTQTFFSPSFGMVADRFGVHWMVMVPQEMPS